MKPNSLATLLIRFFAIYLLFAGVFGWLGQLLLSVATSTVFSGMGASAMDNPIARFFGYQLVVGIFCVFFAFVLYANSQSLGRFIAKGLE
jgi:hypothetical protein